MTYCKELKEYFESLCFSPIIAQYALVYLSDTLRVHSFLLSAGSAGPVLDPTDTYPLELHLVLSESACLITEYELNLAHFFDQVGIPTIRKGLVLLTIHCNIFANKRSLPELKHFNDHIERDRDHVGVRDPVSEKLHYERYKAHIEVQVQVVVIACVPFSPDQ